MTMLPICFATPTCSTSQIYFHGGLRPLSQFGKYFEVRDMSEDRVVLGFSNESNLQRVSFRTQATNSLYSNFVETPVQSASMDFVNSQSCRSELVELDCKFSNIWTSTVRETNEPHPIGRAELNYIESSSISASDEGLVYPGGQLTGNENILLENMEPESMLSTDIVQDNSFSASSSLNIDNNSTSSMKTSIEDFFGGVSESIGSSLNKGEQAVKSSLDTITSSIKSITKSATEAIDNAASGSFSTVNRTGELAGDRLTSFSGDLKEAASKGTAIAVDVLRHVIVAVEDSLTKGASLVVYSYGTAKELLPPDISNALNLSEERAAKILMPIGTAFQQVFIAIEGLEKNLGLDPADPIVPFVIFLGTSTTLWAFYWVRTYGGYSGDLSPQLTLEVLTGKDDFVLIDVRPEVLRETDGVPDLRRAARFRYASVTLPEVDSSLRKVLKSGRDLDDILLAAVIKNLKIVQDRSKIIIMDAEGTYSKGIARSLRKLGTKETYLVQGGFRSWVNQGLRIKELKPETALTILNEEAEAILEDIRPSPVQALGYGVGFLVALYGLLEWEKTLQFIGVVGIVQTIYRRIVSYENSEDLKQDVSLLLAPVRLGAQGFSWVTGKLETNRIGLPTSPSSSEVQNRVLQAAAKHESQPSETEGIQNPSPDLISPVNESLDVSEA